ncbi:myo-inositol-1(or 4)-monophosphatase [Cordyceps fumosorosea ARSEF 2679]|uniref:Myo-inositol-1(Or 4)-monophosphatase n=1 Tax=Cordyceps fumosorosea (strain ARSEF 2679) TaxID=1081104 RepID=A0A168BBG0_CORFA|nr:myo-inositol-1(or 4)-monophosphatase [Cordyceps fumosorosea ARSEF 2679]OAA69887.1 myo-inositol-1(or 4)-monophosphatase [Cordyceps fumosorosea ARSEF 2679]
MDSNYRKELEIAFDVLQKASSLSQTVVSAQDKAGIEKDDLSPVTVADFAVQGLLAATFKEAFPDDNFVGEEDAGHLRANEALLERVWELLSTVPRDGLTKVPDSKEALCNLVDLCGSGVPETRRTWVFDPIDGTRTYMMGQVYAINIALLVDGQQMLSAVGAPNTSVNARRPLNNPDVDPTDGGCIAFAVKGRGAYVRPMHDRAAAATPPRRLPKLPAVRRVQDLRFVTSHDMADSILPGIHEKLTARMGIAFPGCDLLPWVLRWTALAMGLGDTTVQVYKARARLGKVWDHAGAVLLFEETGGRVTDIDGRPLDWLAGRKFTRNFGFVAAPPDIHAEVLQQVHDTLRENGHADMLDA